MGTGWEEPYLPGTDPDSLGLKSGTWGRKPGSPVGPETGRGYSRVDGGLVHEEKRTSRRLLLRRLRPQWRVTEVGPVSTLSGPVTTGGSGQISESNLGLGSGRVRTLVKELRRGVCTSDTDQVAGTGLFRVQG